MATERRDAVILAGKSFTLVGDELRAGALAPDFAVQGSDLRPISLASSAGKTRVLLSVTSIDTSVCDEEVKEFAARAAGISGVELLVVSVDLPFALRRWCRAEDVRGVSFGSDHRDLSFGRAYGVLIKEVRMLSRAAFVVNAAGWVTYAEYVPDVGEQPNFEAVTDAARKAVVAAT